MKGTIISPSFVSSSPFSLCSLLPEAQEIARGGHRSTWHSPDGSSAAAEALARRLGEGEVQSVRTPALGVWEAGGDALPFISLLRRGLIKRFASTILRSRVLLHASF